MHSVTCKFSYMGVTVNVYHAAAMCQMRLFCRDLLVWYSVLRLKYLSQNVKCMGRSKWNSHSTTTLISQLWAVELILTTIELLAQHVPHPR